MKEKTFEVSWAYGETTFINARDEAHAMRVATQMGKRNALGKVLWVAPTWGMTPAIYLNKVNG